MLIDFEDECYKNFIPPNVMSSEAKYRAKNRLLLRVKATKYREENKEKKNNTWKLARRKQRENETIEQREIRLAKRRLYRSSK